MNWKHVQYLCWIIFSVCRLDVEGHMISIVHDSVDDCDNCQEGQQSARGHYYGTEIGSFDFEGATEGGARGTVYAVNKSCIFIRGFSFDGNQQGRDARFSVGRSLKPDDHGVMLPDETGLNKRLGTYFQHDVLLNLPLDVKVTKISWIAVWDLSEKVHYGHINISHALKPPEGEHLGAFIVDRLGYHFHVDDIIIDNIKQIIFVNVGYDGFKAGSSVWIGNSGLKSPESWSQELFHKDRDLEFSTQQPLNVTITLPGNLTFDDLDSVRIWIDEEDEIFGHFIISDENKENLPPYLPNLVEMKLCEVLFDEVYQVSWQLDQYKNKITLELSGRITLNEYMAFGISGSDNKMVGSDVIAVWIDPTTNEPQAEDYHLSDNSQCIGNISIDVCPDVSVPGGTNDVQLIGAVIRDGITTIRVSRPLTSDDSLDNPIQTDRPVLTFWSLGLRFKSSLISHSQLYTSGKREINFGTSEVSDCPDFERVEEEKDSTASKLFSDLSNSIAEEVPSFTGRHISKRNAGSPDPIADLVTNACCFTDCQNGGIGFATVNQQLQCVCPFPWMGPDCATTTTPCNPDPCQNGGTCSVVSGTAFRCDCTAGFTGTICGLVDGGPFQVLCPSNVHLLTTAGNSQPVSATWQEPDAPGYQLIMRSHTPGDLFSVGETIVDYTFGSTQGTQTCTLCVTVQEVTVSQPTLDNCLDVTSFSSSQDGMNVTFTEPTASDSCGPSSLLVATARSGDFFPLGSTSVLFFFQNRCGGLSSCSFTVTVNNATPCPGDIIVEVTNQTSASVTWTETTDTTMFIIISRTAESGDLFALGETNVTISFIDLATNILEDCTFTVTVTVDTTVPEIKCPEVSPVVIEIRTGGTTVTWIVPTAMDLSPTTVTCTRSPGEFYTTGMTNVTCMAVDQFGDSNSCTFVVSVIEVDSIPPEVTCPPDISVVIEINTGPTAVNIPAPIVSDNSLEVPTLVLQTPPPGTLFDPGQTIATFIYADSTGNQNSCSLTVTVIEVDTTPPLVFCTEDVMVTEEIGQPSAVVFWDEPSASDPFGVAILESRSHAPGSSFTEGSTTVSYVFIDMAGNTVTCVFCVTVVFIDTTPPVCQNLPDSVFEVIELGLPGTLSSWTPPSCFDLSNVAFIVSQSAMPNSFFPVGTTDVKYICQDGAGLMTTCSFPVTVTTVDTTDPQITCPEVSPVVIEIGTGGTIVTWLVPMALDLLPTTVTCTRSPGEFYTTGMTTVTCTGVDQSGNSNFCTFVVSVIEGTVPCPQRAVIEMSSGVFTSVQLPEPLTGPQTTFIDANGDPVSQDNFMVGITTAVRRNDGSLCLQNIIIIDASPPAVTSCSEDIIRELKLGEKNISVDWREPSASDMEEGPVTMVSTHRPGDLFYRGVTTVRYTFCDSSNNLATCTFRVIVTESKEDEPTDDVPVIKDCYNNSQIVEVEEGQREYNVTLQLPPITDLVSSSPVKEENFTVILGFNELLYNFSDADGNRETCLLQILIAATNTSQKTAVFDDCPRSITVNTTYITNFSEIFWAEPVAPSHAMVNRSPLPDDTFFEEITVTYTAEVNGIITDKCSFIVNIADVTPPVVFNCPSDINATLCRGARTVYWYEPYAVDNSNKPVHVFQTHEPLKTPFKIGTTRVTYIFEDDSKNIDTCHFNVNVRKSQNCRPISPCWLLIIILILIVVVIVLLLICAGCLSCDKDTKDDNTEDDQEVEEMELN